MDAYYSSLKKASTSIQKRGRVKLNGRSMAGKLSLVMQCHQIGGERTREKEEGIVFNLNN